MGTFRARLLLLLLATALAWAGGLAGPPLGRVPLPLGYGVAVGYDNGSAAALDRLGPVWYYDYSFRTADWPGHAHVLLTRPIDRASAADLQAAARARPRHW